MSPIHAYTQLPGCSIDLLVFFESPRHTPPHPPPTKASLQKLVSMAWLATKVPLAWSIWERASSHCPGHSSTGMDNSLGHGPKVWPQGIPSSNSRRPPSGKQPNAELASVSMWPWIYLHICIWMQVLCVFTCMHMCTHICKHRTGQSTERRLGGKKRYRGLWIFYGDRYVTCSWGR